MKIDDDIPLDRAALVGCGVMTGVGAVFNAAKVEPGATVAVIGCGGVGLSAVNGAALAGAERIIAIDTVPSKLELARELGATDTLNASNVDPVEQVRDMTKGGVHYSFEALGTKNTAEQAFQMLRPGGTATIIGMVPFGTKIELHGFDFLRDRKIQGTSMGGNRFRVDMPRLLSLWRQGRLKLDHLISGTAQARRDQRGFRRAEIGRAGPPADRLRRGIGRKSLHSTDRAGGAARSGAADCSGCGAPPPASLSSLSAVRTVSVSSSRRRAMSDNVTQPTTIPASSCTGRRRT